MKTADIEVNGIYYAYCGSLAKVRVLETGVEHSFGTTPAQRRGVRVEALEDVPWALDVLAARRTSRDPIFSHRTGDVFVIPSRDIDSRVTDNAPSSEPVSS